PGNLSTPYHWQMSWPLLADILSGLVYYFAGMIVAQREARWYGSRGLALAGAFFCSYLVLALPEFLQGLLAVALIRSRIAVGRLGHLPHWRCLLAIAASRQSCPWHDHAARAPRPKYEDQTIHRRIAGFRDALPSQP